MNCILLGQQQPSHSNNGCPRSNSYTECRIVATFCLVTGDQGPFTPKSSKKLHCYLIEQSGHDAHSRIPFGKKYKLQQLTRVWA